jgi:hypothetical protein
MEALVDGKERGRWNWDRSHCLGNKKMYPATWPIDIRRVYNVDHCSISRIVTIRNCCFLLEYSNEVR